VQAVFSGLWPRVIAKLTEEELASFRRMLGRYGAGEVITALRKWKDTQTTFPRAIEIVRQIPKPESTGKQDGGGSTFHDQVRRRWAKERPEHRERFYDMTDHEIEVAFAHGEWEGCEAVYGAGLSSFAAWRKWQRLLGNEATMDELRAEYDRVTAAIDYDAMREARDRKNGVMQ